MAETRSQRPWPTELRLHKDRRTLSVAFDDGARFDLAADFGNRSCRVLLQERQNLTVDLVQSYGSPLEIRLRD